MGPEQLFRIVSCSRGGAVMSEPGKRRDAAGDDEPPPLEISLEKLCFLIVKAREYDAKVPGEDGEDGSNPSDDREVSVLEETPENGVAEELSSALDGLNDDEKIQVLALVWLGRGDYDAEDWPEAVDEATRIHDRRETQYLLGIPQLGDLLEDGLAKLGYSCEEQEIGRL
jgi:hypothetical protein